MTLGLDLPAIPAAELPSVLLRAVGAAQHGITIADATHPDNALVYCNRSFLDLTGYDEGDVLGRNCRFLQGPDTDPAAVAALAAAVRDGRSLHTVLLNYTRDGRPFHNELTVSAVRDGDGRLTHFIGNQIDITERVQRVQRLSHLALSDQLTGLGNRYQVLETLEQLVGESTTDAAGVTGSRPQVEAAAVVFLDVDRFAEITESYDVDVSTLVLVHLGRRLAEIAEPGDLTARLDAETFALVRPLPRDGAREAARALAEYVGARISAPIETARLSLPIRVSSGAAVWPDDGSTPVDVLRAARNAVRAARQRNDPYFF
ncbi:PAS domain-containing protein [Nakamurella leprariae]|uniref:PAS domain-containing protein n=1 Tax=Nakamurella leprariae TaxID=2803911 RepID=A0A939BYI1_9ACTN|nr:GGDEF domain-containing protein [Nakamurella leprariae]MBM9466646.1 PAS domain-containing protein [Nakamurella leprariae]